MKCIHIIGSGFQGLKLASIFSHLKNYKVFLYTNSNVFIFTPFIASMLYEDSYLFTNIIEYCEQRSITLVNCEVINFTNEEIISKLKTFKVNGTIFDCRNNIKRLLKPNEDCTYDQLADDIKNVINSSKKNIVKGHNIHAFEISLALDHCSKLDYIISKKLFITNKYIKEIRSINPNLFNDLLEHDFSNNTLNKSINSIYLNRPSTAQEASQRAKRLSLIELGWSPKGYKRFGRKRGIMIKTAARKADIFIFNMKKPLLSGKIANLLRSIYYHFQYKLFYDNVYKKNLVSAYIFYLRVYSFILKIFNPCRNIIRKIF